MNGFDQPGLPYQFVEQGWRTKAVIDFMNNQEKTVTVARVDPTARLDAVAAVDEATTSEALHSIRVLQAAHLPPSGLA